VARRYCGLFLTEPRERLAERVRTRHRVVVDLLMAVGVPAEAAEQDAEGIEHHVSDATLAAFERFLRRRDWRLLRYGGGRSRRRSSQSGKAKRIPPLATGVAKPFRGNCRASAPDGGRDAGAAAAFGHCAARPPRTNKDQQRGEQLQPDAQADRGGIDAGRVVHRAE